MKKMQLPKTNTQEVLYVLIKQRYVSIFDFRYMSGFRTRVSELRLKYKLDINTVMAERCNKFGNSYRYAVHRIDEKGLEKAIKLYKVMCQ